MSTDDPYERATRYEGFADYNAVSRSVAQSIDDAVDAYARVRSFHSEPNARLKAEPAADASARILAAAIRLLPELEQDQENVEEYQEFVSAWSGEEGEEGYIEQIKSVSLSSECPEWIGEFVLQIRRAGWELGYLQAGRTSKQDPDDPVEAEAEAMFEGL